MKKKKKLYARILGLSMLYLLVFFNTLAFRIDDINFDQRIDDSSSYKEYKVFNDGMNKVRYKVVVSSQNEDIDLSKILTVYPKIVTVDPKSYASFKLFGNSKAKLEKREYSFNLNLMPIVVPTLQKNEGKKTIRGNAGVSISPTITMTGYGGEIDLSKDINIGSIEFKKEKNGIKVELEVENDSHSAIELAVKFYNKSKTKLDTGLIGRVGGLKKKKVEIFLENFDKEEDIKTLILYNTNLGDIKEFTI